MAQQKYWLLTIPHANFTPYLPPQCVYIKGQLELGSGKHKDSNEQSCSSTTNIPTRLLLEHEPGNLATEADNNAGYLHWQIVACFARKIRLRGVRECFGPFHAEPSRSKAANDYVFKQDTQVVGTQFELGQLPMQRSSSRDWELVRRGAIQGNYNEIPPDIFIRYYGNLRRITQDNLQPMPQLRTITCYWGPTGVGKSRRVWHEAGPQAYPKDPRTKFWDGYRGQENVIMDEFRGTIDISHMLRWLDRYPCLLEVKGSSQVLRGKHIWITSNLHPEQWYPGLDELTKAALLRRIDVIEEMTENWNPPNTENFAENFEWQEQSGIFEMEN